LQRNKAKAALENFDIIHTVDGAKIAQRLQFILARDWPDRRQRVLAEINIGEEPQKAGVLPAESPDLIRDILACDQLELIGLMAIPPFSADPEGTRGHFRAMAELREELQQSLGRAFPQLSMGMSHDFEVAISEGATMVRVGTAIFGPRG
jgi:pyridoxal phosphate enzyme (YggS family)